MAGTSCMIISRMSEAVSKLTWAQFFRQNFCSPWYAVWHQAITYTSNEITFKGVWKVAWQSVSRTLFIVYKLFSDIYIFHINGLAQDCSLHCIWLSTRPVSLVLMHWEYHSLALTRWRLVTPCGIICSGNGLLPIQHQATIKTNAGLQSITPCGTYFNESYL